MKKSLLFLAFVLCGRLLAQSGVIDTTFNPGLGTNGAIYDIVLQTDGKIIIGGDFTSYNGITSNRIARLNADGSLDATFNIGTGANAYITAVSIQTDGKIIIGGDLTSYNGITSNRIARLNTDGSLDTTFIVGAGVSGYVKQLALQSDEKIIITGDFSSYNGTIANSIARLNTNGSLDTTYITGTGLNGLVNSSTIQADDKMVVSGYFNQYNGTATTAIIRINTDGSLDGTFTSGTVGGAIYTMAMQADNKIIIGGNFSVYGGTAINKIARLNTNGILDTTFNVGTGASGLLFAIGVQPDAKIIIGGTFTSYNGTAINRIARLNTNGSLDNTFTVGTAADNLIFSIAMQADNKIIIAGSFTSYNGTTRNQIARILNCTPITILASDTIICNGSEVTLTGNGAPFYTWTGGVTDGTPFTPSTTATYTVTGTGIPSECANTATVTVVVNALPDNSVTQASTLLTANLAVGFYQWINCTDSTIIVGANSQAYMALANGSYAVYVVGANGCADTSTCYTVNNVGIYENGNYTAIVIYPNPTTSGNVNLQLTGIENGNYTITFLNALGQQVVNKSIVVNNNKTTMQISQELAKGMYLINVSSATGKLYTSKLIIE